MKNKTEQNKNIYIVIPAFNESKVMASVIESIQKEGYKNIITVDDGSIDNTAEVARKAGAIVLVHSINRGKGAATQTGLDGAKILDADIVVTMDADGQHSAKDIRTLVEPIIKGDVEVCLGSRFIEKNDVPKIKLLANKFGNFITWLFYGIYTSDSQSGFRAYSKKANELIKTTMDRYEYESEVLSFIHKYKLKYKEVPITVYYTEHSKTKYDDIPNFTKQKITNGFKMIYRIAVKSLLS